MKRKKIAFIVHRYGKEVNGGAEVHVSMLAHRLRPYYDIDILTTTQQGWVNDQPVYYDEGKSVEDDIRIVRFPTPPFDRKTYKKKRRAAKPSRKLRRFLFQQGVLRSLADRLPRWNFVAKQERAFFECYDIYSPQLLDYIQAHEAEYDALLFMTYYFPHTSLGGMIAPHKSILIPTAHNEKELFFSLYTHLFTSVRHIAFNTAAEQKLCQSIFGKEMASNSLVATGIELKPAAEWESVREKYQLPEEYLLYLGRVNVTKIGSLQQDFLAYKEAHPNSTIKLVMTGGIDSNVVKLESENILFTGFVSEEEKSALIQHAQAMVNPSRFESLSLLLLEGLSLGTPVLVNGKCEVLQEHCELSHGASLSYTHQAEFIDLLERLLSHPEMRQEMGAKGVAYVAENYSWEVVIHKLRNIIEEVANAKESL